ncbi:MAG: hypothetical protein ACJA01_000913 [Saprospiraceae bacterium]
MIEALAELADASFNFLPKYSVYPVFMVLFLDKIDLSKLLILFLYGILY